MATLTYEIVINDLECRLEDALSERLPGRLGINATHNELCRQYFRVQNVYDEISETMQEIDIMIGKAFDFIASLPEESKIVKGDAFLIFLEYYDKHNKFREALEIKLKWSDRLAELAEILPLEFRLPRFFGTKNGANFWAKFKRLVHEEKRFDATEKFNFLLNCLEGEAKRHMADIPLTPEGYQAAIQLILGMIEDLNEGDEEADDSSFVSNILEESHDDSELVSIENNYAFEQSLPCFSQVKDLELIDLRANDLRSYNFEDMRGFELFVKPIREVTFVPSIQSGSGQQGYDGRKCRQWLRGCPIEVDRPDHITNRSESPESSMDRNEKSFCGKVKGKKISEKGTRAKFLEYLLYNVVMS